jgi:hypothetical protein
VKPLKIILILIISLNSLIIYGQNWSGLNLGLSNSARTMYADSTDTVLYATGRYYEINGLPMKGIAKWNGTRWDSLVAGIDGLDTLNIYPNHVFDITKLNNEL